MITVSELREQFLANPQSEEELEPLRQLVLDQWDEITGHEWALGAKERVYYLDFESKELFLKMANPLSVTTIERRLNNVAAPTWVAVDAADYELTSRMTVRKIVGCWEIKYNYRATVNAGYDETTAPSSVRKALFIQAQFMAKRLKEEHLTVSSQNFRGGSGVLLEADYHPMFKATAGVYRRRDS